MVNIMTSIKCLKYKCNMCGKVYDSTEKIIDIPKISCYIHKYYDLHFCDRECFEKWINEY